MREPSASISISPCGPDVRPGPPGDAFRQGPSTAWNPWLSAAVAAAQVAVVLMMLAMAFASRFNAHPDEVEHVAAARYYVDNWLPPAPGDPRLARTFSKYGLSYLDQLDMVYFFAGKFAAVFSFLPVPEHMLYRLFNISLLTLLFAATWALAPPRRLAALFLLVSAQVWYIYSYFNGDAFALTAAFVLVFVLSGRSMLVAKGWRRQCGSRAVVLWGGLAAGLLLVSKLNFYVFLAYVACFFLLEGSFEGRLRPVLRNLGLLFLVAACVFVPRVGLDKWLKAHPVRAEAAVAAGPALEATRGDPPAGPQAGPDRGAVPAAPGGAKTEFLDKSYWGLEMRGKGHSYAEMYQTYEFHIWSFRTAFGVYDYMKIYAPFPLYKWIGRGLYLMLAGFALPLLAAGRKERVLLALFVAFSVATWAQSSWHSWTSDFQPQGRYLFPIFTMAALLCARASDAIGRFRWMMFLATAYLFALAAWSFVAVGLVEIAKG